MVPPTTRIYLTAAYCFDHDATVLHVDDRGIVLDRSAMFPGGGGQPSDIGELLVSTRPVAVSAVSKDSAGLVWHRCEGDWRSTRRGEGCTVHVASDRRLRLMRAHTALHVFNTVMQRAHGGWITGVKIGPDRSHIDFKVDYTPDLARRVEADVNDVLSRRLPVGAGYISEEEFRARPDLLRTLEADPPIEDGRVRVVEIAGFEAQACGGTHVSDTGAVGLVRIVKVDNKGRQNRRFYIELTPGA